MNTLEAELWTDKAGASVGWRTHVRAVASRLGAALGTLKVRLTLGVAASIAVSTGGITAVSLSKAERELRAQAEARELSEASRMAADLAARLVFVQNTLRVTADAVDPTLEGMDDGLEQFLNGQPAVRQLFANVFVADAGGRMRLVIDDNGARRPGISLADRSYFRQAVDERRPVVSDPVPGRISGEPVVVFSHPIVRDGKVTTVLGGAMRLQSRSLAAKLLDHQPATDDAEAVAITFGDARVLEHSRKELVMRSLAEDARFADAVGEWTQQGRPLEPSGVKVQRDGALVSVAGVAGTNWAVWRALPESTLLAPVQAARRQALRDALVVMALLTGVSLLLIHWLLRPMALLERRARHLFDGQDGVDAGWPVATGEVGHLVRVLRHVAAERTQLERFSGNLLGKLTSVMAAAPIGIAFTRHQKFELISKAWCQLLRRDEFELIGAPASIAFANPQDYEALGPFVADAFARDGRYEGEWTFVRKDGTTFWGLLSGQPVDVGNAAAGTIWTLADVTVTRETRQSLEWSATHDALTGLVNRKGFERRLAAAAARGPSVLIAIDLDKFKPINDRHGHAAGDAVLKAVADTIAGRVRAEDAAVRLGGDEFAVVLQNCPLHAGERVAEGILKAIRELEVPWGGENLKVGASLGVAASSVHFVDSGDWVAAADQACYAAKAAGRGTVSVARPCPSPAGAG